MRTISITIAMLSLGAQLGCAGCFGFGDDPDDGRDPANSQPPRGADTGPGEHPGLTDAAGDVAGSADFGRVDLGGGVDMSGADASGFPDSGADAGGADVETDMRLTDPCGDGVVSGAEVCDDGVTIDCVGTHDGGDGTCVPAGTCSSGYLLSGDVCVANTTGLSVPCQNGSGFTLFRFHYSNSSTSARIDVWDANCSYSFAQGSACNVYEICPGFCDPDTTSDGYPIFDGSDYLRVRFNANGLNFGQATLYVQARSYATSSSSNFEVWSPLYGSQFGGPVDNDFVYDWHEVDWTGYLYPSDDPGLTAIQLYGSPGRVAVKAVELCVE